MSHSGISLVTPLIEANNVTSCGGKAVRLACVHSHSYMVPKGFVVSADLYKMHLWQCRYTAGDSNISTQDLQQLILNTPIDAKSIDTIEEMYRSLGMQVGYQSPQVMVRPSVVEMDSARKIGRKLYEHKGPIQGTEDLLLSIKSVWASVWSADAVAQRKSVGDNNEVEMAVIVQDYLRCNFVGSVSTADPISEKPNLARLLYFNPDTPGNRYTAVYNLESMKFEKSECDDVVLNVLSAAVDKAVLLENVLGECVYLEWGWDGKWLWVFQCDPLYPKPTVKISSDKVFERPYNLISSNPVPQLCIPQNVRNDLYPWRLLQAAGIDNDVFVIDGYLYRPVVSKSAPDKFLNAVMVAAPKIKEYLDSDIERVASSEISDKAIKYEIEDGFAALRTVQGWMSVSTAAAYYLREQINEVLEENKAADLLPGLLGGVDNPFVLRDANIQEFGAQLTEAQKTGKSEENGWWKSFKAEVESFAEDYVYSFVSPAEYYDLSLWESWNDDISQVFRLIKVAAGISNRSGTLVVHTAAVERYKKALSSVDDLLAPNLSKSFNQLLDSARWWISARYQLEHRLAFVAENQRQMLKDAWVRFAGAENIDKWSGIFELEVGTLLDILSAKKEEQLHIAKGAISRSRHQRWLNSRLNAPVVIGYELDQTTVDKDTSRMPIRCTEGTNGKINKNIQIVRNYSEASEFKADSILVVEYPSLVWSTIAAGSSGIVCQHLPEVPAESMCFSEYGVPAVYGCQSAAGKFKSCKRVLLNADEKLVTML